MPKDLGKKHTCYSCQAKFYDLGKPQAICPKCGANQKDAEDAHPAPSSRGRRAAPVAVVAEAPAIEEDFEEQPEAAEDEDEGLIADEAVAEEESEDDEDDDEEYDE